MLLFAAYSDDANPQFQRLHAQFSNPMTEVYLLFYQSALQAFVHFNKFLKREDPLIPILYDQIVAFLRKLASRFILVSVIKEAEGDFSILTYKDRESQHAGEISMHVHKCHGLPQ